MKIELSWPRSDHQSIVPVFLPFMGCRTRCVFCAQDRQTGMDNVHDEGELRARLHTAKNSLEHFRQKHGKSAELAFYGGTFTALPENSWRICLDFVEECLSLGLIASFRCSTRPDALDDTRLGDLKGLACRTVELGIQTFNNEALRLCGRGYDGDIALMACRKLKKSGFCLGVQLLPGMPGVSPDVFIKDVALSCSLDADLMRFYPCLVLEGTRLAEIWRQEKFRVWNMPDTLVYLARALNMARKANITVSRIGLAPDMGLAKSILAGPYHPCLGSRIQAMALYYSIQELLGPGNDRGAHGHMYLPVYMQGFFWGWNGEMKELWRKMGFTRENIKYWNKDYVKVEI